MTHPSQVFSDFIVYVDESGDHSLESINSDYPIFVLSFCVFEKKHYAERVTSALRKLKFEFFGHDMVVFHEHEIAKKEGPFAKMGKEPREAFLMGLTEIIKDAEFALICVVIRKDLLKGKYINPIHPYHLAMEFGLERVYRFLCDKRQEDRKTYIVFESRGKNEDSALELEFRRVRDGNNYFSKLLSFEIIIADKRTNSEGLQLADMTARPIGLSILRPSQANRAAEILEKKFYRNKSGNKKGFGIKCFP